MSTKHIDIDNIKINPIDMKHHRENLRRSLLNSPYWNHKQIYKFLFWKGGEKELQNTKLAVFGVGLSVIVITLMLTAVFLTGNAKTAYAQQIAQKSYQAVSTLTPEGLASLKQKLPMDPSELLQEAKGANDLQTLTYDEFANQYPQVKMGFSTRGPILSNNPQEMPLIDPNVQTVDMRDFKFLQFTDKNGGKVVVGIDQNNLPVFAYSQGKDGSTMGVVKGSSTTGGPVSGFVSVGAHAIDATATNSGELGVSSSDGKTVTVNGQKYLAPQGDSGPSTVNVNNGEVFINGQKATPEQ